MFNNILKSDVLFKTKNVSVLKPNIKKGVILFHKISNEVAKNLNRRILTLKIKVCRKV